MRTVSPKNLDSIMLILKTGAVKQIIVMLGIAVSVALGIVLYMTIQEPIFRPLDYQVTPQNMAAIIDVLEKNGIRYKLNDREGVIYVPADSAQLAKIKLSSAGVQKDEGLNFSFLNDQSNFGNSQFFENARYLRALESDLAKTINSLEGIASAKIHIAIPQNNIFADENTKTTASVVINANTGVISDRDKIRAIVQIVADSVPGLDPKNVAITDQYGHNLSSGLDQNSIYNAEQLAYQNNLQTYYEKRIESMIVPLLGENKVSVRVYANLDFTQQEEAQEKYDPEKKVIRSEQSVAESSDASGGASGPPGSLSNSPPESDSEKGAAGASGTSTSKGRSESIKNYEVGKSVTYTKSNVAKIKSLSVAVVLDDEMVVDPKTKAEVSKPVDQEKINKIIQLIQTTIGYEQTRGDKVTVVNSSFKPVKDDMLGHTIHLWDQPWFWDMAKKVIGIPLGFLMLFMIYRKLSNFIKEPQQFRSKLKEKARSEEDEKEDEEKAEHMRALKQERISQLKQMAATEPTKVANVIKHWVGK